MAIRLVHSLDDELDGDTRRCHQYEPDRPDLAIDALLEAISSDPGIYQRSGRLVQLSVELVDGVSTSTPTIREITPANLRDRAASLFRIEKQGPKGWVDAKIPDDVIAGAIDRGRYPGVRPISGVIETPSVCADGRIMRPGWDAATGLVYVPTGHALPVIENPSQLDALDAMRELCDIFRDFPFAGEANRASCIAALLTMFARPAFEGTSPLIMIEASTRGTGKSRMIDAIVNVAIGRDAPKRTYSIDAEEMRKSYTSAVLSGRSLLVLDNVARVIGDPTLDSLLTSTTYDDRQLGKNVDVNLRHWLTIFASANNPAYAGDTARRTLPIRLESPLENPEDRGGFAHPDLLGWVRAERPRLMRAALTVLRAYILAGKPDMGCKVWGSFESWSRLIPHAVMFGGIHDPMHARTSIETAADPARNALGTLLDGWASMDSQGQGLTVAQVMRALYPQKAGWDAPPPEPAYYDSMREALLELAPPRAGEKPEARAVGVAVRRTRNRVVAGKMFVDAGTTHGSTRWAVRLGG